MAGSRKPVQVCRQNGKPFASFPEPAMARRTSRRWKCSIWRWFASLIGKIWRCMWAQPYPMGRQSRAGAHGCSRQSWKHKVGKRTARCWIADGNWEEQEDSDGEAVYRKLQKSDMRAKKHVTFVGARKGRPLEDNEVFWCSRCSSMFGVRYGVVL